VVREYLSGDASSVVLLHRESGEAFEDIDVTEDFIDFIAFRDDFRFFVAVFGGRVVGFCGILFYPGVGRAEIGPVAVDRGFRRRGIGRALCLRALEYAGKHGVRRVTVKVKAGNTSAVSFFSRLGFVQEGFFSSYTRMGEDVVQCVKFI